MKVCRQTLKSRQLKKAGSVYLVRTLKLTMGRCTLEITRPKFFRRRLLIRASGENRFIKASPVNVAAPKIPRTIVSIRKFQIG